MPILDEIMDFNRSFVQRKDYEAFRTDRFPNKRLVIVTCMDTRLVELLPRSMNLRNGDVKIVKIAGAIVSHPFGSVMRSILVAVYELEASEVAVIGHHGCGMTGLDCGRVLEKVRRRGVPDQVLEALRRDGVDLERWLTGFERVEDGVRQGVAMIRQHPLLPKDLPVHGLVICPETGKLDLLVDGYRR
jgi:carbonic anhydrase